MKKLIVILAVVALASPVMAAVTVSAVQVGTTSTVEIRYSGASTADPCQAVRAFALDITTSAGTITAATCANASYYIYPGSIQISGGSVQSNGDCKCTPGFGGALGGVGTSGVTLEMGSLYTGATKPAASGVIATLTLSACTNGVVVSVVGNAARGGVVFETPESTNAVTYVNATLAGCAGGGTDCYPSTYSKYNEWKSAGKPNCWCGTNTAGMTGTPVAWKFQCYGDADNKTQQIGQGYRVYTNDYAKLVSNWQKKITDPAWDRCSDFDHRSQQIGQSYRVYTNDYYRMISNWQKKDSQFTGSGNCPVPNL